MKDISFDYKNVLKVLNEKEILDMEKETLDALNTLLKGTGEGKDFTGWVNLPMEVQEKDLETIKEISKGIRKQSDCLVIIGIGGSYLGSKAAIDMLSSYYSKSDFKIIFLGYNMSGAYLSETLEYLKEVDFSVNVISKSGKTLEPALAFHMVLDLLIEKYGDNHKDRVYVTTSSHDSILHNLAVKKGYKEFFIPDNVGGRYSVLTPVGLLPLAVAGMDIYEIIKGAINANQDFLNLSFKDNPCLLYAAIRNLLYRHGKTNEIFVVFEPKIHAFGEWWKQLYGESEGKDCKGIFPVTLTYTTDLHSIGQYVQDGLRNLFETFIDFKNDKKDCIITKSEENLDDLNYLAGKSMSYIKDQALKGTAEAHLCGDTPNMTITVNRNSEYSFGYLVYFFMLSCGVSGYLLGVNPFNQNGVEAYKKNMFALLKK